MWSRACWHRPAVTDFAWACEGHTWGPRRRAATFPDGLAVGMGPRAKVTPEGQRWRSVQWCRQHNPMAGIPVVVGDPSVVGQADEHAFTVAVQIGGQDPTPGCLQDRQPAAVWDAEALPLHPWAWMALPDRAAVRRSWGASQDDLIVGCLDPSWAPIIFSVNVRQAAPPGVIVRTIREPEELVGCDYAVVSAGWASTHEARWSGVDHWAVNLGRRDMPVRASTDMAGMLAAVSLIRGKPDLPDDLRPRVPDHREQFIDLVACHA